jgi:hypothetical protein
MQEEKPVTSYDKILRYIESFGHISMLDGHIIKVTAISQRCNEMIREPLRYEKYLKGRRIVAIEMMQRGTRHTEYQLSSSGGT